MRQLVESLRTYNEAILRSVDEKGSKEIISKQHRNIEQSRIQKFMRTPMIDFIFDTLLEREKRPTRPKMYGAFIESTDLTDFLKRIGLSEEKIREFIVEHESDALRDYAELSERYKGSEPLDDRKEL
jgi:hypothetical protein